MTHPTRAYGYPSYPPPKRRGLHPMAIVGIVVGSVLVTCLFFVGVFAIIGAGDDNGPAGDGREDARASESEDVPGIGDPARDGKFEFTVTEIETGVDRVGDEIFGEQARGQYVLVHVTVENIGDRAQTFTSGNQKLIDTAGREHSADAGAARRIENSESFLNEINPGIKVEGVIVFDIPLDAVPASLELHDSFFSGGVQVALTAEEGDR